MQQPVRNRILYGLLTLLVLALGLASRRFFADVPFIRNYVGDGLWALMVFFGIAFVFNRRAVRAVALAALLFSVGIELSQLYQSPWINNLRASRLGGLVLGFGFLWSDIVCYTMGIAYGVLIDTLLTTGTRQPERKLPTGWKG
jgi:hypothetical protein